MSRFDQVGYVSGPLCPFYYRGNLTLILLYYSAGSRRLTRSVVTADGDCARRGDRVRSREHVGVCAASSTTS